ncbi:MAG: TIGR03013 family XrtA/PEP-CTERM system glycosyltransferase [Azonexus sp.]
MIRHLKNWFHWRPLAQALLDSSFVIVGVAITVMWHHHGLPIDQKQVVLFGLVIVAVAMFLSTLLGLYQKIHKRTIIDTRTQALLSIYLSFPIAYTIYVLLPLAPASRELAQLSAMSAVFGILVSRISGSNSTASRVAKRRILVFGTGIKAHEVKRALNKSDPSAEIVGFFAGPNENDSIMPGNQIISRGKTLSETAMALNVQEIVVALSERRSGAMPLRELLDCKLSGIQVLDLASYFEKTLGQIRLDSLYAGWLIFGDGFNQGRIRSFTKRIFDIVCSLILLTFALPVMLVTTLLIILESGFPVFYRQERVGRNGRLFDVIKFRSMRCDAEKDGKPVWAKSADDRVTRVGRIIRKLRIDELPQLYCVLKGDMSLVGPRPERPFFVDQLTREIPFYAVRHSVKPGVTGWAQVCYHYGATVEDSAEKLQYDLYYVKNHSLFLDLVVLFETVGVVITGKGAY